MAENKEDKEPIDLRDKMKQAMDLQEVPKIHANGFITAFGNADTTILFQLNGYQSLF